ncbi:glycosyltransferase family 2 protein [Hoeflea sp. WL0058]|uniref:Glycosyltransferase family 2 protein n=1 Tax=Flavimaribacter sediminis TaxID=2865987 RepID=A0AAE2ZRR7_9HYPH|nr:glycosyltransferase family 2 protein [Flavimaribacter sediminis]MBW8639672.1 glycosyltransferase family 2 protein [Flavimaribacter sediminis]
MHIEDTIPHSFLSRLVNEARSKQILRYYLIIIPILWIVLFFSYYSWRIGFDFGDRFALTLWIAQDIIMVLMIVLSAIFMRRMIRESRSELDDIHPKFDSLTHVVLLPCYNEPPSVLMATLDALVAQSVADRLIVVMSFEESSPDLDETRRTLEAKHRESFRAFHITIHPAGIPGEIRGKCSNARWTVKSALEWTRSENIQLDMATTTLTSMDSDTILHRRYFEVLGDKFLRAGDDRVYSTVWQGGLFYNFGLDRSLFFTRVTGLLRTIWMIGFNIPLQSHSMSVSSYSLKLCCDNNLFDPTYQMDDMHFFVKSMVTRRGKVWLKPIYLPVICGPTSGNSFSEELREWARQARRWSIGAFEIFHYVVSERRNLGYLSTLRLCATILLLYGLFQTIMFASTIVASPIWHYTQWHAGNDHLIWYAVSVIPWLFIT